METYYSFLAGRGVRYREFISFSTKICGLLGINPNEINNIINALKQKPRIPVLWFHGLECTCCSESLMRSSSPVFGDIISLISLEYDDLISSSCGEDLLNYKSKIIEKYKGNYILAVEGSITEFEDGACCMVGGRPFNEELLEAARYAKVVIAWGSCASFGCVQAANPNPTKSYSIDKVIKDKPIVKVPGCPPIPEIMAGVILYMLLKDDLPPLDSKLRPKMFYGMTIHDSCYRKSFYNAGKFAESFDDEGAKSGHCLYKLGCKGPSTYNACSSLGWYNGLSFPVKSGHGCIGCSQEGFWDKEMYKEEAPIVNQNFDIFNF
ncbi:MAG: uptake hydrogenase small subunit [Hydrogenobaculum sp.]|nr:MAG: uptake hydrogenase small subunit [Hydrogenobaculum sp.]